MVKNKQRAILCFMALVCLMIALPGYLQAQQAGTINVRAMNTNQTAEEVVSSGNVGLSNGNLDMVDPGSMQLVGIHFDNVQVPQGSVITEAYIVFRIAQELSTPASFTIKAQDADDPGPFSTTNGDISGRACISTTVAWNNVNNWDKLKNNRKSEDISSIVEDLVGRSGWVSGNDMVFIIGDPSDSGRRVAYQAGTTVMVNGKTKNAGPKLHIEYTEALTGNYVSASNDDAEEDTDGVVQLTSPDLDLGEKKSGIIFQNVDVPAGRIITNAYIEFTAEAWENDTTSLDIYGQASSSASSFDDTGNHNISNRDTTDNHVEWNSIGTWSIGQKYQTPDLSAVVQEIVGSAGWVANRPMCFIIEGTGHRMAYSYDGASTPSDAARLYVEYSDESVPYMTQDQQTLGAVAYEGNNATDAEFTISNTGTADMTGYAITCSQTWLTTSISGGNLAVGASQPVTVSYTSSGLAEGTHEATITIKHDATVGSSPYAYNSPLTLEVSLTINVLPGGTGCGNVPVYTENLVNPAIMILLDVSGSMRTYMDVSNSQGNPTTPSLNSIVKEVIDRDDWVNGESEMAFIIKGSGNRRARSYNGSNSSAPLLHVTYNTGGPPVTIDPIRVSNNDDDGEERTSDGDNTTNGNVLDLGDRDVGIRFRDVPIPKGATIESASIEFVIAETDSSASNLTIYCEDIGDAPRFNNNDDNISDRDLTDASVAWTVDPWEGTTQQKRITIAKDAMSELVKDRSIAWGFGTWTTTGDYIESIDYTQIHVGCKNNDDDQQAALQASIASQVERSYTPLTPSLNAGRKYFEGTKAADNGGTYAALDCQPTFLITVTDGLGNTGTTTANVITATEDLCAAGITPIVVGFGIDDATQIQELARVSNEKGSVSDSDSLYSLHDEVAGVGQPFIANNRDELIEALSTVTEAVKANIFHGSAPAPTTSSDLGDTVLIAKFDASDWSGDMVSITKTVGKLKLDEISGTFQDNELLISIGGEAKVNGTLSGSDLCYDGKVSNFSVGEEVIGGTSGATGTIYYLNITGGSTGTLSLSSISGSFIDDEDLTSIAGSATVDGTVAFNQLDYGKETADFSMSEVVTGGTSSATGTISGINIINDAYGTFTLTSITGTRYLAYDVATTDFAVGETVTGGTSSATGIIAAVNIGSVVTTGDIRLVSVSGTFADNEALTGDSGGAATANGTLASTLYFEDQEALTGNSAGVGMANSSLYHALAYDAMTREYGAGEKVIGQTSGATAIIVDVVEIWELENSQWSAKDKMPASAFRKVFTVDDPDIPSAYIQYTDGTLTNDNFLCKPLGDIINSTPLVVGTPAYWYEFDDYLTWKHSTDRDTMVYIGANDGFLHAISLEDVEDSGGSILYEAGEEKWAFLPHNLRDKLDKADDPTYDMCNDNEYCHQYFVDGTPVAADIYDGTDWKTILVCGENEGGEAFFALDITSGESFDDVTDPSVYLWEFEDSGLGQTWSEPCITRVYNNDGMSTTAWGVYLTSGYSELNQDNQTAHLYGLVAYNEEAMWNDGSSDFNKLEMPFYSISYDAETTAFTVGEYVTGGTSGATATVACIDDNGTTGNLEFKDMSGTFQDNETITGSTGGSATVDGTLSDALLNNSLSSPIGADLHQQDLSSYIYTGDLYGIMYRISNIGKEQDPQIMKFFHFADYPSSPNTHPIRAKATYAFGDVTGYIWTYFGTGRYETQADKTSMSQQYFFGMEDSTGLSSSYVYDEGAADPGITTLAAKYITDPTTGNEFRYIDPVVPASASTSNSWAVKLDNTSSGMVGSERIIEEALVVGGIVFFATFIPDQDVCAGNGDTWIFALDYKTGLAPGTSVFDMNGDGKIDENDVIPQDMDGDGVIKKGEGIRIAGIPVGSGQGSKPVLFGDTLFITTTGGGLTTLPVNLPGMDVELRFWRHN